MTVVSTTSSVATNSQSNVSLTTSKNRKFSSEILIAADGKHSRYHSNPVTQPTSHMTIH